MIEHERARLQAQYERGIITQREYLQAIRRLLNIQGPVIEYEIIPADTLR